MGRISSCERTLEDLVAGMNRLTDEPCLDFAAIERQIVARDRQVDNTYGKDFQVMAIRAGQRYLPDRISRIASRTGSSTPRPAR